VKYVPIFQTQKKMESQASKLNSSASSSGNSRSVPKLRRLAGKFIGMRLRMPQYSFGMRTRAPGEDLGPGPGAYKVDKLTRYGNSKGLEFSIAPRTNTIGESVNESKELAVC